MDIEKCSLLFFQNSYLTFLSSDFTVEPKTNPFPEFSFRFFAVKNCEISFSKVTFGGKFSMKKQRKFQEKDSQDFRIHLFVHTSVIAKSSSLDNFISFS
jgi:hypothetical protein